MIKLKIVYPQSKVSVGYICARPQRVQTDTVLVMAARYVIQDCLGSVQIYHSTIGGGGGVAS